MKGYLAVMCLLLGFVLCAMGTPGWSWFLFVGFVLGAIA